MTDQPEHSIEDAMSKLNDRILEVLKLARQALANQPTCFLCHIDRANAKRAGVAEADLPPLRPVAVILPVQPAVGPDGSLMLNGGGGVCTGHFQVSDGPAMPGRTASGLVLPGVGVA